MKNGLVVSDELFKNIVNFDMNKAQRLGKITFDDNLKLLLLKSNVVSFQLFGYFCLCVLCSLLLRVIIFMIYLSSTERRDLPSSHLHRISKEMKEEKVFLLHVATPT